ncbi:MAG: capsule biosynthesis protein [Kiritimatiellae bacterium]|nr:capsule biosynthesis protein [Kiritimatiellia bacterium]
MEALLAVALTLRGAEVHFLLCDRQLPACLQTICTQFATQDDFLRYGPSRLLCDGCFAAGKAAYDVLGLPIHRYSELISAEERYSARETARAIEAGDISGYAMAGVNVGEHAMAGALRYFGRGTLDGEALAEPVLRRYLLAALLSTHAVTRLFDETRFDAACFHHGIYVPQGIIGEAARHRGLHVANWCVAYRKRCFVFSHLDTYHRTMISEPADQWESLPWTEELDRTVVEYLASRGQGSRDWIKFHAETRNDLQAIGAELGIDFSRPCIGMLTNIMWDAQLFYRSNAFPNILDWCLETIRYFARRPDLQLIIRIHPAEVRGTLPSRQPMLAEIRKAFPSLPANVFVIPPDSPISTYALMAGCNAAIIYGTKMGVELTSVGIPVIVAGEAWIRGKGLTRDAKSPQQYFGLLDELPLPARLREPVVKRARKYAFHYFFRRMIPIAAVEPQEGFPPYHVKIAGLRSLLPGQDRGLDVICNGVLTGAPFVFPAEDHVGELQ